LAHIYAQRQIVAFLRSDFFNEIGSEYPSWSSHFWHPNTICFDTCARHFDEVSHDGDDGDDGHFGGFSCGAQAGM
jgi:hypothetical protein